MRTLLLLRPEPGATATAAKAEAQGMTVRRHPLFRVEPVDWTLPSDTFDGLLLTSANAVRQARALPDLPIFAVGEATADAARNAGGRVVNVGSGGVEALLDQVAPTLHLLHLAGAERIAPSAARQSIETVTVYRTVPLGDPPAREIEGSVLLVHSPAAGRRVAAFDCQPCNVRIAAISMAAAEACGPRAWARVEAAARPEDGALLSLAAALCKD